MDRIWSLSQTEQDEGRLNQRHITPELIEMIEEALATLGEYGEVRLIVVRGRLRFVVTQRSMDVTKWQPGSLNGKDDR
jgi:hypothetical protein